MSLGPDWFAAALEIVRGIERSRGKSFDHSCITNLLGYGEQWIQVFSEMFGNHLTSSMDFPNIYRMLGGSGPDQFSEVWRERLDSAREAGMNVAVTSVINHETLELGAERFYTYYVKELGVKILQLNTIFSPNRAAVGDVVFPLDNVQLSRFYGELIDIYLSQGRDDGIVIDFLDRIVRFFSTTECANMLCELSPNCVHDLICIDPEGNVFQCDNWHRFPEYWFGNIAAARGLNEVLAGNARRLLIERPSQLLVQEDCGRCEFLGICHGGCALRSLCATGDPCKKDPYCAAMKALFSHAQRRILGA